MREKRGNLFYNYLMQTVIQGILTNYQVLGKDNKDNLLILHGWGQDSENWLNVAEELSKSYKVVLLDLPGFGSSNRPDDIFDTKDYSNFVNDFIEWIKIKNITLVGHSFGGKISIYLASQNPNIRRLFLISPSGIQKKNIYVRFKIVLIRTFRTLLFWLPKQIKERFILFFGSKDYKNAGNMREILKKVTNDDVLQQAQNISIPTYIFWGEKDSEIPVSYSKVLKKIIKGSILRILWGVGHSPNLEKPNKLSSLLLEYL